MKAMTYWKTDKNGTEYYLDYTCPRCGGAGGADQWAYTGWTCYNCGGSGRVDKPQIVKKYTPEYRAKLDERAKKRAEKERLKRVEEFKKNLTAHIMEKGFNEAGKLYVVVGNTYEIKEELKEAGAKWFPMFNSWAFTEKPEKWPTVEIDFYEVYQINEEGGWIDSRYDVNCRELIYSKLPKPEGASEYVGEVGKRLDVSVTYTGFNTWEAPSYTGWGTVIKFLYKFKDDNGNTLVWVTTGFGLDRSIKEGAALNLRGTVKAHSEYKGEKQTELSRCKVKVA